MLETYRFDIINGLIGKYGYKRYLEIGTQEDVCLYLVNCEYKVGVDPDPINHKEENSNEFYEMTSDDFFEQNTEKFDIIFVDGLHENIQVRNDIGNAIACLSAGGTVVVHDCNPQKEESQRVPMPHVASWNGDVWKAWIFFRHIKPLYMFVVDTDQGCGIIRRGWQTPLDDKYGLTFEQFAENRKELLNLISVEEWTNIISV